jgi:hypothetical protein
MSNIVKKPLIIASALAALAVAFVPSTALADHNRRPPVVVRPPHGGHHHPPPPVVVRPDIEVLVHEWKAVPVYEWQWTWDSYSWTWTQVRVIVRYDWVDTHRWVRATWDSSCGGYVYWSQGHRHRVQPGDQTRPVNYGWGW